MSDHDPEDAEPPKELRETQAFDDESNMIVSGDEETAKVAGHDGEIRIYVVGSEQSEWVQSDTTVKDMDMGTDSINAERHDTTDDGMEDNHD